MQTYKIGVYAPMNLSRFAGDTTRIIELIRGVRQHGMEVTPFIPKSKNSIVSSHLSPYQEFVIPSPHNLYLRYGSLLFFSQYVVPPRIYDSSSFDIVQIELPIAFPGSKIRKLAKKENVLFDMHSIASLDLHHYLPKPIRNLIIPVFDEAQDYLCRHSRCLVVSNAMKRYIIRRLSIDPKTIYVIPNGVNLPIAEQSITNNRSKFLYLRDQAELLLVYVGGLEWYEGIDVLIYALSELQKHLPTVKLVIAGSGTEEHTLRKLVSKLHLNHNVIFYGWIDYEDTFALQSVADILVAPRKPLSKDGIDISTPMKIPSYLTAGVPIVASNIGEIPMVARHGREAVLVNDLTSQKLCHSILDLMSKPEDMRLLSQNCKKRAHEYSWETITSKILPIYDEIMNSMC